MTEFETIRNDGRLLYEYIRGSHLYGLNTNNSDVDTGGLFCATPNQLMGLGLDYKQQVSDERNDTTWYEIGRFCNLLLKSNATVLESLFVPEDKMLVKPNALIKPLFDNKEKFITKACFKPFISYAIEQIRKARGLNKKIVNPITERLKPLDFCYTFREQGSTKIEYWLEYRGLSQEYCGLVKIPNMEGIYGVYYDWGRFFEDKGITVNSIFNAYQNELLNNNTKNIVKELKEAKETNNREKIKKEEERLQKSYFLNMVQFLIDFYNLEEYNSTYMSIDYWFNKNKPIGYRGIVNESSNELRLSSVAKWEKPICYISYNQNGYTKHCVDYKNYQDWVKFRNPKRYESNLNKNYDSKNMMHSFRLMQMGIEIASGQGVILDRNITGDKELLMKIRNHEFEYDELMEIIDTKKEEMDNAIKNSTIPDNIDIDFVNSLLIYIRKEQFKTNII